MSIIEQLGLNHTYFFQFFIFIFALLALSQIFKEFSFVVKRREHKISGGEHTAEASLKKANELGKSFEQKAREINNEIRSIFDFYRQEANAEYEKNISTARTGATKIVEEARRKVASEIGDATKKLKEESPLVAQEMVKKLVGGGKN